MTDNQSFTTKDMPEKERRKLDVGDIWSNTVECGFCHEVIRSHNRHHMNYCECGNTFVDGGSWYQRCGGRDISKIKSLIEYYDDVKHE